MPSGAVTLLEAAKGGTDMLKAGTIETLIQESPLLLELPWQTIAGNALKHTAEDTLPTTGFRAVNANWNASWGTDTEHFWGVAIMGGEIKIDNFIINTMGNPVSQKRKQFTKQAKSNSRTFDYYFFNGDGTGNSFKGVKQLISEGFGQSLVNAANGGAISLDILDQAMDLLRTGAASAILANRFVRRKVTSLGRSTYTGFSLIDIGTDVFGRQVTKYNDVPIHLIGDDMVGSPLLPFTETQGASSVCTSVYVVRYGDDLLSGLLGANGHMDVRDFGEQQAGPYHMGRLEWYPGIAIFDPYAVVRIVGVTAA
jgi:hypothetical protein